jgi:endogenous inhibitor of DNA gyrase (YacG/DUF329 family)
MIRLPECPICHHPVAPASDPNASYAPFCSRRCKEVDLIRWCEGRYAIVESIDPNRAGMTASVTGDSDIDEDSDQGKYDGDEDYDD